MALSEPRTSSKPMEPCKSSFQETGENTGRQSKDIPPPRSSNIDNFAQNICIIGYKICNLSVTMSNLTFPMIFEFEKSNSDGSISQSHLFGNGGGTGFGSK